MKRFIFWAMLTAAFASAAFAQNQLATNLTVSDNATFSARTITRVPFFTTAGLMTDAASLTFNSGTGALSATSFLGLFNGNTVTTGTGTLTLGTSTLTASNNVTLASDGAGTRTLNIGAGGTLGTGATNPQTVLTGTANQIAVSNSGVGATALSIPANPTIPGNVTTTGNMTVGTAGTIVNGTTGSQGITAVGTNQSFTITPSGTGTVVLSGSGNSSSGLLQLPTATTKNQGISFGTDFQLFQNGSNELDLNTSSFRVVTASTVATIALRDSVGAQDIAIKSTSGSFAVSQVGVADLFTVAKSTGDTVLLGSLKTAGFARVTGDVTNATATMSNLTNLSVTVASGVKYTGTIQIFGVDSTNVDGLSFDLGGGNATFTDLEFGFAAQPTGATLGVVTSTTATTAITLTVVSTSDAVYTISFGFTCNAGGTFIPRFSQTTHSTGTATVRKNSSLTLVASTN